MCGFSGYFNKRGCSKEILHSMAKSLNHRGPDDQGIWVDPNFGVGMAHTRLAILDLTQAGHQPMTSFSERFVIVFNGEIYNHIELREELDQKFKSNSLWTPMFFS